MSGTAATASQAWAILKRHARDEIAPLRLQELCRDNDRVSSLVAVYNATPSHILLVDLSRQRMTLDTLNSLLRLATARQVKKFITQLSWGQNDPDNPVRPKLLRHPLQDGKTTRFEEADEGAGRSNKRNNHRKSPERPSIQIPSLHLSLRAPANEGLEMLTADGVNVLSGIHREWERMQRISDALRRGQLPGITGNMIRDVVVVGRGVPIMALRFVYLALLKDESATIAQRAGLVDQRGRQTYGQRRIKFLTSVDPIRAAAVVADLDPASTIVISIALKGDEETFMATRTMKTWLLQSLGSGRRPELVLSKHMMLITGNERIAAANKPESVFVVPEHSRCEAFTTFSAATLLVSNSPWQCSVGVLVSTLLAICI
jgi:glucose-6-phosphate isomerase